MRVCVAGAAALLGVLFGAVSARAAGNGVALDQFEAAPPGDTFFGVPSPHAQGNFVPRALAYFDYASQPLRIAEGDNHASVVGGQAMLHIAASLSIQDRLLISASLPIAVAQNGDSPTVRGTKLSSPTSAQVGDLRVGLRVRMVGDDGDAFQLGVGLNLHTPTAPAGSFTGEGVVRAAPQLLFGGRFRAGPTWVWSAAIGAMIRPTTNPSTITYGGGIAASLFDDRLQIGPEAYASTPLQTGAFTLDEDVDIPANTQTNAEILLGVRTRLFRGLVIGCAVGPGLTKAIGTPEFRFVGTLGWAPGLSKPEGTPATTGDTDGDGIPDVRDACPYAFGPKDTNPKKNGCPVIDDDEDGVPDDEDACHGKYGPRSKDPKKNGCPVALPPPPPAKAPR
ncbi:outer membrane protein OmpA [Minicystis rosea]|nr:outer membrane protein OmpA [Minicystis rosea]